MKIGDIDKNLAVESKLNLPDAVWFDVKEAPIEVRGLAVCAKGDKFRRMPQDIADATNDGVKYLNTNTAGGRIRFRTDSPYIAIKAVMPDNGTMAHITMVGQSGFDLYRSDAGDYHYAGSFIPGGRNHGYESQKPTDGKMHTYTINMPLYDPVEEVYIGLATGANLEAPEPYKYEQPVLYYGSSITQGGNAARPGVAYQAFITRRFNVDHINLGFSEGALGEDEIADYIKRLPMSLFVYDYDHNAPTAEHLRATHEKMFKTVREANPTLPIIMMNRPKYSGFTAEEIERRNIIYTTYQNARSKGDGNVYFIDGRELFADCKDDGTSDMNHPTAYGFASMARAIGDLIKKEIFTEL